MTVLATATFLAFGAVLVLYGANATELIGALDLDYAQLGLLGSMLSLSLGVGIVSAGPLVDRLPRRPFFVASCALVAAGSLWLGPETSYRELLVATLAIGFGAGCYETILNTVIIESLGTAAPRRLVLIHSAATLAATLTPLAIEALRAPLGIAWFDCFRGAGGLHLLLIGGVAFVRMPSASRLAAATPASAGTAPADPQDDRFSLAAICLSTFAYIGVEAALTIFVADHATTDLGLDASRAARTISAFWGGLLVGRLAIGLAPRAPGAGTTALLASVAALVVSAFGAGWIGVPELAMALTGFFLGGVFPVMIGLAGIAMPSAAGTAVGLAGGLGSFGGFVVPWLTGRLATSGGLPLALSSLGAWLCLLVAAASAVHLRQRALRGSVLRQSP